MSLQLLTLISAIVFFTTGAVSGTEVVGALGGEVSFGPDKPPPPFSSIIWKHIKGGETVKAIEWEEGETIIPNPRFNGITTLDMKTGQITISKLTVEHSGVYTIDINGKEQAQRYTLTVIERVPKPVIKIEPTDNPGVVYLRCEYSETIIWRNSAGETLTGSTIIPKGESITVKKKGNPEIFYTCTLQNAASEETSERVYVRDLFKEPVPKPVIKKEPSDNPDVWYLRCEYNETIIWKNSAGETLKGSKITPKGESIRVKKIGNPEIFYTCTLQNAVSEETSERVYERDMIKASNKGCVVAAVVPSITMMIIIILFLS